MTDTSSKGTEVVQITKQTLESNPHFSVSGQIAALQVLQTKEYSTYLTDKPDGTFFIDFNLGRMGDVNPGSELYSYLVQITSEYAVEVKVFPLDGERAGKWTFVPLATVAIDHGECISISIRKIHQAEPIKKEA